MTTPKRNPSALDGEASMTMIFPVTKAEDQRITNRIGRRFFGGVKIVLDKQRPTSCYDLLVMVRRRTTKRNKAPHDSPNDTIVASFGLIHGANQY